MIIKLLLLQMLKICQSPAKKTGYQAKNTFQQLKTFKKLKIIVNILIFCMLFFVNFLMMQVIFVSYNWIQNFTFFNW